MSIRAEAPETKRNIMIFLNIIDDSDKSGDKQSNDGRHFCSGYAHLRQAKITKDQNRV